jgi:hypothetical protein
LFGLNRRLRIGNELDADRLRRIMIPKKPPSVFEVHFEGAQLYPEAIPLRTMADAFAAIQRLVSGGDRDDEEEQEEETGEAAPDDSLRLLEVKRGSAVYKIAGPPPGMAKKNLRIVGRALEHPENLDAEYDYILSPIERLSSIARRLGCTIVLREPSKKNVQGPVLATIEPLSYETISKSLLIQGETSFTGKVVRVGGATALRCGLRVPFRHRLLICKVKDQQVARDIGQLLYSDVVVTGTGQWLKSSWRIVSFTIFGIRPQPVQGSIVEAMEALREAGGKAWDLIDDPRSYLEGIESAR